MIHQGNIFGVRLQKRDVKKKNRGRQKQKASKQYNFNIIHINTQLAAEPSSIGRFVKGIKLQHTYPQYRTRKKRTGHIRTT